MSRSSQIIQAPLGMRITNTSLRAVSSGFAVLWPSCVQVGKNAAIFAILPITKLDPAALLHGKRLLCGGGKHQSKVSEMYLRHKTVFVGVPVTDRPV